eukprot:TRINITY_DN4647_c0_g1_i1.p1 TRINITY_DN4647_c0_g1~~TRINITY_DN4647_c0_g1_i1.p1  ORF type:complete len:130 (+),score=26.42 TRINITY_DN4647_c0_g1_i1:2-391(+)
MEQKMGKESCDIIIDFIGASYMEQNLSILREDGRSVLLATLGGKELPAGIKIDAILKKRLTIQGSNLRARDLEYKGKLTEEIQQRLIPLFESGKIKPIIDKTFKIDDVTKAHQCLEENKTIGKVILTID